MGEMPSAPGNVVLVGGEYYVSGTQSGIVSKNDVSKKVTICSDSGYLATPECKHRNSLLMSIKTLLVRSRIYSRAATLLPPYF